MTGTALILGANGRFGRNAGKAFETAGWTVRRFDRKTDSLPEAALGADVIVNGWNPPGYRDWKTEVPRITAQAVAAAEASGATLIVPGSVYNFGKAPAPWSHTTPQRPITGKGRIRAEMEQTYRAAAEAGRIRVILLRAGDFIDPDPAGTWPEQILKPLAKGRMTYPGKRDIPHAWAWLPDLGRAAVALAELRDHLPPYADIPYEGYTLSGRTLARMIGGLAGMDLRITRMPWWALVPLAPFSPMFRGLLEMSYLWDTPHSLDGRRFRALVPGFRTTPPEDALGYLVAKRMDSQGRLISTQTSRWSEASAAGS
ncbi:Rossmann-fold NAD(P)-binding domain-containing protein [Halovulum sp. GXIMD14794]